MEEMEQQDLCSRCGKDLSNSAVLYYEDTDEYVCMECADCLTSD
jgi:hypothetical protein